MKQKSTLTFLCILNCLITFSQWSNYSFQFGGTNRQYRVYVPSIYNVNNPASLVLTLHGMGDNMTNFSSIGMNLVADTANIIVVVPQALSDQYAGTTWNSGAGTMGYFPNASVNDIGFINALIDTIQANYSINAQRVYSCGFSMGGFMTQRLGCELTNRFTAIASVSGTIGIGITNCTPSKALPVAHFHGTADQTVPYSGNTYGNDVDSLINLWITRDNCTLTPTLNTFPDIASDGYTIDHYIYPNGIQGTEVELFKVNGADHVWLTTGNDIDYTIEIWKFFNKHQTMTTVGINELSKNETIEIFPNPVSESFTVKTTNSEIQTFEIITINGQKIVSGNFQFEKTIETSNLSKGIYIFKSIDEKGNISKQKFTII
ncbi:MAG: T9SS type A sorting domain-containing protein [Flavobacteriia bacterium]|nr:T9SS type A sorting domain-containing protein [Flavobacteriia bacterium]